MVYLCQHYNLNKVAKYWEEVININEWQKDRISKLIVTSLFGTVSEKKLSILGFSFKANTNDTRNSASIKICQNLIEEGAFLSIYDPKVEKNQIEKDLKIDPLKNHQDNAKVQWIKSDSLENAIKDSHAIILLTEWDEFKNINLDSLIKIMKKPSWIFDTRLLVNIEKAQKAGFQVWQIGNKRTLI